MCSTDTTPQRLRDALLTELLSGPDHDASLWTLALREIPDADHLVALLRKLPVDDEAFPLGDVDVGALSVAVARLLGSDLIRFGDVDDDRRALAEAIVASRPELRFTDAGRRLLALQGRWDEVVPSWDVALRDASDWTVSTMAAERLAALRRSNARRADSEHAAHAEEQLRWLAQQPLRCDARLRDRILPALAPYVWGDRLRMHHVPMHLLQELLPLIRRRHFYRIPVNAQPSLRELMDICAPHAEHTTFGGTLYLGPGLRFDTLQTLHTPAMVAAFRPTADELSRVDGDRLHVWWD